MAVTTIHVSGLRELGEAMRELKSDVALRTAGSMTGAAAQVVKKAAIGNVIRSPSIETGSLRDSIITKKIPKSQTQLTSEHIVTVRGRGKLIRRGKKKGTRQTSAPHGSFVEFGTEHMQAEPFLKPALANNKEKAIEAMVKRGKDRIEAVAKKAKKV
jgi:HK97 gp10 family phage protein